MSFDGRDASPEAVFCADLNQGDFNRPVGRQPELVVVSAARTSDRAADALDRVIDETRTQAGAILGICSLCCA
jgi:hypothetical protein